MARSVKIMVGQREEYECFATNYDACSGGIESWDWLLDLYAFYTSFSASARVIKLRGSPGED